MEVYKTMKKKNENPKQRVLQDVINAVNDMIIQINIFHIISVLFVILLDEQNITPRDSNKSIAPDGLFLMVIQN